MRGATGRRETKFVPLSVPPCAGRGNRMDRLEDIKNRGLQFTDGVGDDIAWLIHEVERLREVLEDIYAGHIEGIHELEPPTLKKVESLVELYLGRLYNRG